jgi:hypothetical protein
LRAYFEQIADRQLLISRGTTFVSRTKPDRGIARGKALVEEEARASREREKPAFNDYSAETFAACKPLGPFVTSNSTACPSFRDLYPSPWMAEKWTKTSSPDWRWMNPNPFAALNHFTVPCSLIDLLPSLFLSYLCFSTASSRLKLQV